MRSKKGQGYSIEDFDKDFGGQLSEDFEYPDWSTAPSRSERKKPSGKRSKREKKRIKRERRQAKEAERAAKRKRKDESAGREKRSRRDDKRSVRERDLYTGKVPENKKRRKKKVVTVLLGIVILILALGAVGYSYMINKLDKVDHYSLAGEDLDIDPRVAEELKDYKNILLLGIDAREWEDVESCRSDACIIASINKKNGDIKLISIQRDAYLDLEESGYNVFDKITHAHAYGGPINTIRSLNRNLDLNIESFVRLNWQTVADFTDAMGGLELDIKENEIYEMNKYIYDTNESLHGDDTLISEPGKQTLNGVQTVTYCRIRKGASGGDEARSERMRNTIIAAFDKAKTMSLMELDSVANKILPDITTSMSSGEIMGMILKMATYSIEGSINWPYNGANASINGVSYVVPVTLESNVIELHQKAFGQSGYTPTDRVLELSQSIITNSGYGYEDGTEYY